MGRNKTREIENSGYGFLKRSVFENSVALHRSVIAVFKTHFHSNLSKQIEKLLGCPVIQFDYMPSLFIIISYTQKSGKGRRDN